MHRLGYLEGIVSVIVNLLLFVLKYWAGMVTGSLAILADAWHTLSDSASSLIVIGSVKLSARKPDREHPFGHGRYQQIASLLIALLLGIVAYEFMSDSIEKFRNHESTRFGLFAVAVTVISILAKEGLAQYALWAYRKSELQTLKADAWHHRSDALSSLLVLTGILVGGKLWWIDSVLGFVISLMLFYAVFEILRESTRKLLGEPPPQETIDRIHSIIREVTEEPVCPHHFHIHTYGLHKEMTFHIQINGKTDIQRGHEIATDIEKKILQELDIIATIHIEPLTTKDHPGH
ncbi:MAG: cation transporter [Bacteroidales bacterium]|nr:cation transporter [Bacteroidales bacterium]